MSRPAGHRTPPFYAVLYVEAETGKDAGLHSEAVATLASSALLHAGFLGTAGDRAGDGRAVRIIYWDTYARMTAWIDAVRDLIPHRVALDDCVGETGCLWPWLENSTVEQLAMTGT